MIFAKNLMNYLGMIQIQNKSLDKYCLMIVMILLSNKSFKTFILIWKMNKHNAIIADNK